MNLGRAGAFDERLRADAREIFQKALARSSVQCAFPRSVSCERDRLLIHGREYDLRSYKKISVVSMGKAATSMLSALENAVGRSFDGVLSSSTFPPSALAGVRCFRGGHPRPNEESRAAAVAMLDHVKRAGPESLIIYLISGGGSSMVEKPIDDRISLQDLAATYDALVHSGAPIAEINAVRKHLSAIKGGKLAVASAAGTQISLLISDVPDGMLDALASGPTMPDVTTVSDCLSIYRRYDLNAKFPASVCRLFQHAKIEETPKSSHPAFGNSQWFTLISNASIVQAAKEEAEKLGYFAAVDNSCDDWDYKDAANYLFDRIRDSSQQAKRVCLISGGEVTVRIDRRVEGVGGRNQHFALYFATKIQGAPIAVLSGGTDGIDGNSSAAGGVTDGSTVVRARAAGFDVDNQLASYDSNPLLVALDDAIVTGPTGNNLRDLRIILSARPSV